MNEESIALPITGDTSGAVEALARLNTVLDALEKRLASMESTADKTAEKVEDVGDAAKEAGDKAGTLSERLKRIDTAGAAPAAERIADKLHSMGAAAAATMAAVVAFAAAVTVAVRELSTAASAADDERRAIAALGPAWGMVQQGTNDTISALQAYRAEQSLVTSGLRVSAGEFALIARYAREHKQITETTTEAVQRFTDALREGEQGGLRQFGITVQQGATRARTFESALRQMARATGDAAPPARTLQEETERFNRSLTDAGGGLATFVSHVVGLPSILRDLSTALRGIGDDLSYVADEGNRAARGQADQRRIEALRELTTLQQDLNRQARDAGLDTRTIGIRANLNRLTTEQIQERLAQARALAARPVAIARDGSDLGLQVSQRRNAADVRVAAAGEDTPGRVLETPDLTGETQSGDAEAAAGYAALGALRRTRGDRSTRARAAEQARLREGLLALRRGTDEDFAAATATTRQGPRDAAAARTATPTPTPDSEYTVALLYRLMQERREQEAALRAAEIQAAEDREAQRQRAEDEGFRRSTLGRRQTALEGRDEARRQRTADLADLRDPAVQEERGRDRAEQRQLDREQHRLDQRIEMQRSFVDRYRDLHQEEIDIASNAMSVLDAGFSAFGEAMSRHVEGLVSGRETAKQAITGLLADTVSAIGKEAYVKAAFFAAEAIASLVTYQYDRAAQAAAASALFLGVGTLATGIGVALGPSPASTGASAPSTPAALPRDRAANDNAHGTTITNVFYAPVFGGRQGTDAEVGERIGRYTSRARARSRALTDLAAA